MSKSPPQPTPQSASHYWFSIEQIGKTLASTELVLAGDWMVSTLHHWSINHLLPGLQNIASSTWELSVAAQSFIIDSRKLSARLCWELIQVESQGRPCQVSVVDGGGLSGLLSGDARDARVLPDRDGDQAGHFSSLVQTGSHWQRLNCTVMVPTGDGSLIIFTF